MKTRTCIYSAIVVLVAIVVAVLFVLWRTPSKAPSAPDAAAIAEKTGAVKTQATRTAVRKSRTKPRPAARHNVAEDDSEMEEDDFSEYPEEDRPIMRELQKAYDDEDLKGVLAAAAKAARSKNRDVREEALNDLDWFGKDALAAMTPFMADPDPDIASDALTYWGNALDEVEGADSKAAFIEGAMAAITDEEALDEISDRLIDLPEKIALQVIVNLAAGPNEKAAAAAKEEYEFITGDEYTTFEAAEKYLREEMDGEADE